MTHRLLSSFLYLAVFISGATILVIEILGTRILAPLFGTTIYVWSGLITVTLFSLATGYFWGGKLADRFWSANVFFSLFFLAGLTLLTLLHFKAAILLFADTFGYAYGPLVASSFLFLIPLIFLGMVDPFVIRLEAEKIATVGSRAGLIFGISTIGGLAGGLTSAYILLPILTISQIFNGMCLLLCIVGGAGYLLFLGAKKKNYS